MELVIVVNSCHLWICVILICIVIPNKGMLMLILSVFISRKLSYLE